MKAEKKIYNLIIKTPHFKMFEEVCSYFDLSWRTPWDDAFAKYREEMAVAIGDIRMPMQYGYGQVEAFKTDNWSRDFEIISYPEFEARFLNKNDMELKKEDFAKEFNELIRKYNPLFGGIMNEMEETPKEPEKKVWKVEEVLKEAGKINVYNELANVPHTETRVPTEDSAKKVLAFCQLLTVAHWANGGEFVPILYKTTQRWEGYYLPFGFKIRSEYNKFLSVHGVEDLLKTFFGIEEDVK